jgi:hypothetical protein
MTEMMSDSRIQELWNLACRVTRKGSVLGGLLAEDILTEMEQAGVTTSDIERLFPEQYARAQAKAQLFADMAAEYGPPTPVPPDPRRMK